MAVSYPQPNHGLIPTIQEGLTKRQIAALAEASVDGVLEGGDVFRMAEALAAMEEFVKTVRRDERFVQQLRDELSKHHGQLATRSGAKIELCEAGVRYDYAQDGSWRTLDDQIRALQEEKKMVEERLRRLAPGRMAVDPETGEVVEGAVKTSKSTYRITLAK